MNLIFDEIVNIEEVELDSLRYDITVEKNNNFFANGVLVHNCQNLIPDFNTWKSQKRVWEITEKLDGSSMTCYYLNNYFGVCSRNIDLIENENNTFWKIALKNNINTKLTTLNKNLAIQGELCGPNIQGNKYKLTEHEFFVFNVYDIDTGTYLNAKQRQELIENLNLKHVPIISTNYIIPDELTVDDILLFVEGKSVLNSSTEREGFVFKSNDSMESTSFKAISNKFLLKNN